MYAITRAKSTINETFIEKNRAAIDPLKRLMSPKGKGTNAIRGYRGETSQILSILARRRLKLLDDRHFVRDEARWLAFFCTVSDFGLLVLQHTANFRQKHLKDFFNYYGVDIRTRKLKGVQ